MLGVIVAVAVILTVFAVYRSAARRFEARQRKLGRWDEYGPLVETQGPPHHIRGGNMDERREMVGDWEPTVVRHRRPHEKP